MRKPHCELVELAVSVFGDGSLAGGGSADGADGDKSAEEGLVEGDAGGRRRRRSGCGRRGRAIF
jgi:hypothetical protein